MSKAQGTPAFAFPWASRQSGRSGTDVRRFDKVAITKRHRSLLSSNKSSGEVVR